jgi:hypothetical protein
MRNPVIHLIVDVVALLKQMCDSDSDANFDSNSLLAQTSRPCVLTKYIKLSLI